MTNDPFDRALRDALRRIASEPAPIALRTRIAAVLSEPPARRPRTTRRDGFVRWATGIIAAAVIVLVAGLIVLVHPPGGTLAPGATTTQQSVPPKGSPPSSAAAGSATPTSSSLPFGLADTTWVTLNHVDGVPDLAGTLSGNAHLRLPSTETVLGAAGRYVVSAIYDRSGSGGTTLIVRELPGGAEVLRLTRPGAWIEPAQVAVSATDVYFAMRPNKGQPEDGVYAVSFADATIRTLLPADHPRVALQLSPSGRTLVSEGAGAVGSSLSTVDVVRLDSGTSQKVQVEGGVRFASDRQVFTDGSGADLSAYDVTSGRLDWSIPNIGLDRGYATTDGSMIVVQVGLNLDAAGQRLAPNAGLPKVAILAASSGKQIRALFSGATNQDVRFLWTQVSTDAAAVLIDDGHEPGASLDRGGGRFVVTAFDLRSSALPPISWVIATP